MAVERIEYLKRLNKVVQAMKDEFLGNKRSEGFQFRKEHYSFIIESCRKARLPATQLNNPEDDPIVAAAVIVFRCDHDIFEAFPVPGHLDIQIILEEAWVHFQQVLTEVELSGY